MHVGQIREIPLNETTAYLAGVIIGDGYLADYFKSKNGRSYKVQVQVADSLFLSTIAKLTRAVVPTKARIIASRLRPNCQQWWSFSVSDKSWWLFLTRTLGIPFGKKSRKVSVPELIQTGDVALRRAFIAGLFDADGGFSNKSIGFTTASPSMSQQLKSLCISVGFDCTVSSWVLPKYNWKYYRIRFRRHDVDRFLKEIPIRDERKKEAIKTRFFTRPYRSGLTGQ